MLSCPSVIGLLAACPAPTGDLLDIPFTATDYAVAGVPTDLAVGDFNGDGAGDVALVRPANGLVTVYLGNGDGTLALGSSVETGIRPVALCADDVDGDGELDLVAVNYGSHDASVLGGQGDGTFELIARPVLATHPLHAALGDLDGDGDLDLAATTEPGEILVLSGDGQGDFSLETSFDVAPGPIHNVVIASLNPEVDALGDVLVAANLDGVSLYTHEGGYAFTKSPLPMSFGGFANWVAVGDTDVDGDLDVVAIEWDGLDTDPILIHNQGAGGFSLQGYLDFDEQANRRVLLANLDGDGFPDSLTLSTRFQSPEVVDYFTILSGELEGYVFGDPPAEVEIVLPKGTAEVAAADLTGDGFDDILSTNVETGLLTVRVNDSCPGFPLLDAVLPLSVPALSAAPTSVVVQGCGLVAATAVAVDGVRVDSFSAPTTLELAFDMPLVGQLGAVDISVDSPNGPRSLPIEVVAPAPLVVLDDDGLLSNAVGAASLTMGAAPGDVFALLASPSSVPSVLPGVLEADIGNGFGALYFVTVTVVGAQAWEPFGFGFSALPVGLELYFQGAVLEAAAPSYPLATTDVVTATVVP